MCPATPLLSVRFDESIALWDASYDAEGNWSDDLARAACAAAVAASTPQRRGGASGTSSRRGNSSTGSGSAGGSSTSAGGSSSSNGSSSTGSGSNRHLLYNRDPTHSLPFMALITAVFGYPAETRVPLWRGAAAPRLQTIRNIVGGAAWDALVLAYRDDICARRNETKATVWNLAVTAGGEPPRYLSAARQEQLLLTPAECANGLADPARVNITALMNAIVLLYSPEGEVVIASDLSQWRWTPRAVLPFVTDARAHHPDCAPHSFLRVGVC